MTANSASMSIPAQTAVGPVALTVSSLARSVDFYEGVLGLSVAHRDGPTAVLSAGTTALLGLREVPGASRPARRATGLYHFAILMPSRPALARALMRLLESRYPLQGASDHLVSEAIYLADPDGHGIELYADRPRDRWPRRGERVQMATDPLDLEDLLGEAGAPEAGRRQVDPATVMGHVHLRVADLGESEAFYSGVLGFEVTQRDYPGALFVAAGGYHHHIGLNIWGSAGAPPPPPDALALRWWAIRLPDDQALGAVVERVRAASIGHARTDAGWLVRDPSQNLIILASETGMGIATTAAAVPLGADRVVS